MSKNGKYTKHTRIIYRMVNFVRNGKIYKLQKIYWCEGGMQLEYISPKHFGKNDLTTRTEYIMVSLEN